MWPVPILSLVCLIAAVPSDSPFGQRPGVRLPYGTRSTDPVPGYGPPGAGFIPAPSPAPGVLHILPPSANKPPVLPHLIPPPNPGEPVVPHLNPPPYPSGPKVVVPPFIPPPGGPKVVVPPFVPAPGGFAPYPGPPPAPPYGPTAPVYPLPALPPSLWILGVQGVTAPGFGVQVTYVYPGTPAVAMGIEVGDVIVQVNGKPSMSNEDLRLALANSGGSAQILLWNHRTGGYVWTGGLLAPSS